MKKPNGNVLRAGLTALAIGVFALALCGAAEPRRAVIAYLFVQDGLIDAQGVAAEKLTHINYAFADIRGGKVVEGFARDAENFRILNGLKSRNPGLKILVSIGGWTWSGAFSDMALGKQGRSRFIDSAVDFLLRHRLDGIDIDWEYPGLPGFGNPHRPADKKNFTALMKELRRRLDREGRRHGVRYLTSCAVGAFPDFLAATEMGQVQKYVDMVNLMTYDFYEAGVDPVSGHHAPLFTNPADPKKLSADWAVRAFLAAGVPAAKLVLGVPFYGRGWTDVAPRDNGLFQPGKEARLESSYKALAADRVNRNGFVRIWDPLAAAPFLWNGASRTFITYEDPQSLQAKCRYIRAWGLKGVMFWELGDDNGDLLDTIHKNLRAKTD